MRPRSTASTSAEGPADPTDLLAQALERAVVVARQDSGSRDAPPPPVALRPVLRFTRLPSRALQTVYEVLDADDDFRSRVAATVDETDLDRASWVFLDRPEGWESELELLSAAADEELADERATREEQSATRRLAHLEETAARLRAERDEAQRVAEAAEQAAARERRSARTLEAAHGELARRCDELDAARTRAVKELKAAEALAADRLTELRTTHERVRELEAAVTERAVRAVEPSEPPAERAPAAPPSTAPDRWAHIDPSSVADAVAAASQAATTLSAALGAAAELLSTLDDTSSPAPGAGNGSETETNRRPARTSRPPRRTPVRLRQGVHEDSPEGVEQLLAVPGLVGIVDGYNVSMEQWPALERTAQRESLIRALGSLAARFPATLHVVFDGDDDGRRPAVGAPLPVRVHFSHAEVEADDRILAMVAELPTDVPVMVVSTDRRVADGARRLGANAVRSAQLIGLFAR